MMTLGRTLILRGMLNPAPDPCHLVQSVAVPYLATRGQRQPVLENEKPGGFRQGSGKQQRLCSTGPHTPRLQVNL